MRILAIDPGTTMSGFVVWDTDAKRIHRHGIPKNEFLLLSLETAVVDCMAIEMIAGMGMAVGQSVFETCTWIGKFEDRWDRHHPESCRSRVTRMAVKMHICGNTRAKDANIRQALIDRFEPTGGGKIPQIGTKKQPGPLFGVSSHVWPALGVALTSLKL